MAPRPVTPRRRQRSNHRHARAGAGSSFLQLEKRLARTFTYPPYHRSGRTLVVPAAGIPPPQSPSPSFKPTPARNTPPVQKPQLATGETGRSNATQPWAPLVGET
jgi:hypothetical protein